MEDISKSVRKVDSLIKMSGEAKYVDDIKIDGMLYAKTVRSTKSKAIIKKITLPKMPVGYHTVDHTDIPGENVVSIIFDDMPIFVEKMATYYGEPIMLVVGEDKNIITDIISKIEIEYEELTPLFENTNSAINYHFVKGDSNKAFKNAKKVIKYDYSSGYQEQLYIEPQGMIGYIEGEKVTLIGSIQCPYYVKNAVNE